MMNVVMRLVSVLLVALVAFGTIACDEDPMRRGKLALGAQNADEAEASFKTVLKSDPDNLEAKRLMADVHLLRDDFTSAEETLDELWKSQKFGEGETELSVEQKAAKELMERQYRDLYKKWAEEIDSSGDPEKFERVVVRGLEFDPKSVRLNTLAVQHYMSKAERLVEEGKKAEAAAAYEAVLDFRATKAQREEAETNAKKLRLDAYSDTFDAEFTKAKPKLVEAEMWDEDKGVAVVRIEADVDRSLRGNDPAQMKQAQMQAAKPFALALRQLVVDVAGLPQDADFTEAGVPVNELVESDLRRGKLTLVAHVEPEAIKTTAFAVIDAKREAEANAAENGEDVGDDKAAEPAADADAGDGADAAESDE